MRLAAISDLHGAFGLLPDLLADCGPVDLILLPGDITNFGTPEEAAGAVAACREAGAEVLAVAGNCDSEEIAQRLVDEGCSVSGRGRLVDGVGFFGASSASIHHRHTWEVEEAVLEGWIRDGYTDVRGAAKTALVSHAPPYGLVDRSRTGSHGGSRAVRAAVERLGPALVFCGHIHEARGVETLGGTTVVNCGVGRQGEYALAELGEQVSVRLRRV